MKSFRGLQALLGAGLILGTSSQLSLTVALAQTSVVPIENSTLPASTVQSDSRSIWSSEIGKGFRPSTESFSLSSGATYGLSVFGSKQAHDLAQFSLSYGHMLSPVLGEGRWYRGNFEFRLELFTGAQFSPSSEWFVGLTPHVRYNFATGSRWVPFVDAGCGVTATSIDRPDLSGTFEFNLQFGVGVQWFVRDNLALTLEAKYIHWSCAGITKPNEGLNGVSGLLGLTWYF